jgi:hypothetical protein
VSARTCSAILAALALLAATDANAAPLPPVNLHVGGGDSWYPDNRFCLWWQTPEPQGGQPVAAVHYRVRDPLGTTVVGETRIDWAAESICGLRVPRVPAAYDAEVWLEDGAGSQGAAAAVKLRFDDVRPGDVAPLPTSGWISRTGFPYALRIEHVHGAPPLSGIRGYAISIDSTPNGDPCAAATLCTDAETDLHGGADDDSLSLAGLPEGTSYAHAVAVSGSGMKSATPGHTVLHVDTIDPVTQLTGAPGGWTHQPVSLSAVATDGGSGMGGGAFTAIQVDGGTPRIEAGPRVGMSVISPGVHEIAYYARDAAGNVNDGGVANRNRNAPPSMAIVRIDRDAPTVAFANSPVPGDPELVQVRIADALSGPDPSRGWIGVRRAGSGDLFDPLPSEAAHMDLPAGVGLQAHWDSDAYSPGEYEFWAVGYDRAGNATTTTRRSDGTRMALQSPLKIPTTLRAGFTARGRRPLCGRRGSLHRCGRGAARESAHRWDRRLVPLGRGTLFGGRLIAGIGTPLRGRAVRIVERFVAGSGLAARVSTVRTGDRGNFATRLPPGPSREVTAEFAGTSALARSVTPAAQLGVRSAVRLRTSSALATVGGKPIVFRGQIAVVDNAGSPRRKAVQLQFRLPRAPWSEFRTVQTDRSGRFSYAYVFSDDDSRGVRFQFRAYVPAQRGWPYEPGGSRPVMVRGR